MGKALEERSLASPQPHEFQVELMTPELVLQHWPDMAKELQRIPQFWDTWWTLDYLQEAILRSEMQCWAVGPRDCFFFVGISRVLVYPANRILSAVVGFGHSIELSLPVLIGTLQKYAATLGCTKLEVVGRPGWKQILREYGFKQTAVVLSADVPNTRTH